MHKDELLQLHSLLCQVKRFFDEGGFPMDDTFTEYEELEVSPQHIHKSKTDHKRAVFLLGKGLSDMVLVGDLDHRSRLRERFLRLAESGAAPEAPFPAPEPVVEEPQTNTEHLPAFALAALSH